jgi:hypothetical protein
MEERGHRVLEPLSEVLGAAEQAAALAALQTAAEGHRAGHARQRVRLLAGAAAAELKEK